MPGIYVASKAHRGAMWRKLRNQSRLPIVSTWIDESEAGATIDWADLWRRCVHEAATCTALVLYVEEGDALKGALVEAGAALGNGRPVFYVGPPGRFSCVYHPLVVTCDSLEDALTRAFRLVLAAERAGAP